jgi:branched-chain amino acid transport system ATP-binding protein
MTAPGERGPILELDDVSAAYGGYRALFGVSFAVPERGIVALLGSNGAGKSTLARVISGLLRATDGTVRFAGRDVTRVAAHRIARLGLVQVPEGRGIFSSLTVEENLRLKSRGGSGRRDVQRAVERAFDAFPVLRERRKQLAGKLSGGQQRILSLAKVLSVPPRLLVVDELSLDLAPVAVDAVYEGLIAIREAGTALLLIEQQIHRALEVADSAVLLSHGSVAWSGPSTEAGTAMEGLLGAASASLGASAGPGRSLA